MSYCDTCCHQFSDVCGGCETLNGVPVQYENRPVDKITLREAVETDAWLMVWAAEPGRNINVQMTYADLWEIRKWIDKKTEWERLNENL